MILENNWVNINTWKHDQVKLVDARFYEIKLEYTTCSIRSYKGALSSSHFLELTMDLCIYKKHSLQGITHNKQKQ